MLFDSKWFAFRLEESVSPENEPDTVRVDRADGDGAGDGEFSRDDDDDGESEITCTASFRCWPFCVDDALRFLADDDPFDVDGPATASPPFNAFRFDFFDFLPFDGVV